MQVNTKKTELALKDASSEVSLFVINAENEVKALEQEYESIVPDASNKDGYKYCKEVRAKLLPIKSSLEGARKTLKAPILSAGKLVDSSLNPLAERVASLYKPFEEAYRQVDNEKKRKEEERQVAIRLAFDRLTDFIVTASGSTSTVIETLIDDLADFDLDPKLFMERTDEAAAKHSEVMEKLGAMLLQAVEQEEFKAKQREIEDRERAIAEKEAQEQARIAEEKRREEQAKQAEEMRIAQEKAAQEAKEQAEQNAAKAKIEAEARHKRELEQAEQRAKEQAALAEKKAKEQAELAAKREREAIEAENRRIKQEAELREKDRKHKAKIHNEILASIKSSGISQDQAKSVIRLVASGKVPHVHISY